MCFRRTVFLWLMLPLVLAGQRFYADDPLWREPPPIDVKDIAFRDLNVYVQLFRNTFTNAGQPGQTPIPAQAVNTLGEAPDSAWYTRRHFYNRMSLGELARGAGDERAPAEGVWRIVSAKAEGITPGFIIEDAAGRQYILKVDPPNNLEMASGAEVVASKFFHALGYNVPENYIVYFERDRLRLAPGAMLRNRAGKQREMAEWEIDLVLENAARDEQRGYRAVASLYLGGKILGPYRFRATRSDDPNDIVPHEHRRDLRGLYVFSAWLGHHDIKESNTLDVLVNEGGRRFVKHYLVDFNAALGSDSIQQKRPRDGYEYLFSWNSSMKKALTLGVWAPPWASAEFPYFRSVGRMEYEIFEPEKWRPRCPLLAFSNRSAEDSFWAAKQVMAFTDEEIRAIVASGLYSDQEAERWLVRCLVERRDKIGDAYLPRVLPLDRFRIAGGRLEFDDLAAKAGLPAQSYQLSWSRFDNQSGQLTAIGGATGRDVPVWANGGSGETYYAARVTGEDPDRAVTVYVRQGGEVVGIERTW